MFCLSEALNKCDSPLRRPVLHIMKCQESEAWWINLSAFNRDIISSTANSAEKCSGLAKAPWKIGQQFSASLWFSFCRIASEQPHTYTHFLQFHTCMKSS